MAGRTMPTECPHGETVEWPERCFDCDDERIEQGNLSTLRWGVGKYPAEAVAQLVADGVLVERECGRCDGVGRMMQMVGWDPPRFGKAPCLCCDGSGRDGTYRLVLPDGEEG